MDFTEITAAIDATTIVTALGAIAAVKILPALRVGDIIRLSAGSVNLVVASFNSGLRPLFL